MRFSPQLFEFSPNLPFSLLPAFLDISSLWASCLANFDAQENSYQNEPWVLTSIAPNLCFGVDLRLSLPPKCQFENVEPDVDPWPKEDEKYNEREKSWCLRRLAVDWSNWSWLSSHVARLKSHWRGGKGEKSTHRKLYFQGYPLDASCTLPLFTKRMRENHSCWFAFYEEAMLFLV